MIMRAEKQLSHLPKENIIDTFWDEKFRGMKMNFYAKSKKHILKYNEKEKVEKVYSDLIEEMADILSKAEIAALENEKNNIINDVYEEQKTLREHLDETVECAEKFFEQYGKYFTEKEKNLIYIACKYHDVGKANLVFQAKLSDGGDGKYKNITQVPHGFLSALTLSFEKLQKEFDDITKEDFKCLVTAVYYHHTRDDEFEACEIREFSEKYFKDCFNEFCKASEWKTSMRNRGRELLFVNSKAYPNVVINEDIWQEYMLIKGMLNKFDWTVSSGKIESEEKVDFEKKILINNIDKRYGKNMRAVQKYMREKADSNVVIIAPTGSGKTEAALYWLNGEKGFYTLPLKVSSNAIYKRIREEYNFKDAALLHSESLQKYIEEETYRLLEEYTDNVYSLHARYIKKHRKMLEKNIMQFSENRESIGIWVTTQIVEASLDIDFDILYTEMCTADSLLQRMGRCNRKGRYIPSKPNIKIYKTENAKRQVKNRINNTGIYYRDLFERSWECMGDYENQLFTEEQKINYINEVYDTEKIVNTEYYKEIEAYLEYFQKLSVNELSKMDGKKKFRMIESVSVMPDKIYNENEDFIEKYQSEIYDRHLGREAKEILKTKLDELTLSVTIYNKYSKEGIEGVIEKTDIHRTDFVYDFDEETGKGIGLSKTEREGNIL